MATKRKPKLINKKEDIDFLLNLQEKDLCMSLIMEMFGEFDGKKRFNPYDEIDIPPNSYGSEKKKNKNKFRTTVGLWVFNKYFVEKELFDVLQYVQDTITDKQFKKLHQKLVYALTEDDIDVEQFKTFLMKTQKVTPYVSILSPSHTMKLLNSTEAIDKKKKELMKKYEDKLKAGDEKAANDMEKELMDFAKEYLKDDPGMDSYNSGARGSFGNNFKNMFIMKGAIKDPDPNKGYNIITSNYMDGVKREEYSALANSLADGPYKRAKKTEVGGTLEKLFLSAFQHILLDPEGSDCHTDRYIEVALTDKNIGKYMYSYIIQGSNLIELTSKNMNNYIGKKVKFRFSSLCESKTGICSKCAGNLFYRLGYRNVGMATPVVASKLKNISMKGFHQSNLVFTEMNPMIAFGISA